MGATKALGGKLGNSFGILKVRGFRYLFFSNIAINFGQWFQQIGLGWLVFQITGSAAQLGAITATQGVFLLLSSPVAGVLADRVNRRRLLLATTAINAAQAVALALLVGLGHPHVWELYIYAIVGGVANAISQPVRQAFLFDLVGREGIARAIPINQFALSGSRIIGPAVAGAVVGFTGTANVFYAQGVLAAVAMGFTFMIGPTSQAPVKREPPLETLRQGFQYAASTPVILGLLYISMIPMLAIYPLAQFLPFFAVKLHGGAGVYGLLSSGAGYGGVVGLLLLAFTGEVKRKGRLLLLAYAGNATAVALFTFMHQVPLAMLCMVLYGFCNSFGMATLSTMLLVNAREDMRGRVMSLSTMLSGLSPIGALSLGLAISRWGPNEAMFAFTMGALALVGVSALVFSATRKA